MSMICYEVTFLTHNRYELYIDEMASTRNNWSTFKSSIKSRIDSIGGRLKRFTVRMVSASVLSLLIETAFPVYISYWAASAFRESSQKQINLLEFVLSSGFHMTLAGFTIIYPFLYWIFKKYKREAIAERYLALRHVLVRLRAFFWGAARAVLELPDREGFGQSDDSRRDKNVIVDLDRFVTETLEKIFGVFVFADPNLNNHYRVSLMQPQPSKSGEVLKITHFWNSENRTPTCMSLGIGFKKREGCAGTAWSTEKTIRIDNIPAH